MAALYVERIVCLPDSNQVAWLATITEGRDHVLAAEVEAGGLID